VNSLAKIQTSITLHGVKRNNLKTCRFNGLIKPLAMIHGPGQAGPWIDRWLNSGFENRYEARLGLRKIDETRNELQVKEYFRKRIEKRSARLKISNIIPESF
jgi:hypothetical protein